jgi:alpha-beta hydrolase superfamily lysophospholipase
MKNRFNIENIPAILWGKDSDKVIIAVHGNMSNKEDIPIELFAEHAIQKGYQVLSFDLPEHGDRKNEDIPCKVQNCVEDLMKIMEYAKIRWNQISLFANSMGAYFSLLAYQDMQLQNAWFLSPLVDMRRMIENMMMWFEISEERLEKEQIIPTPIGQSLYWDYYTYVKEHPVNTWNVPTAVLYGSKDEVCEFDTITKFVDQFSCKLKIVQDAEHYFHTEEQLKKLEDWLEEVVK